MNLKVIGLVVGAIVISLILLFTYYQIIQIGEGSDKYSEEKRNLVRQDIDDFKLKRLIKHRDIVLTKKNFSQISPYQKYVTPNNPVVKNYVSSNQITTAKKAYSLAVKWIWVSDQTLHGVSEKWLMPSEFIQNTPNYPTNPVAGNMVSDCESQAYTLVSILESIGLSKQNVRVVVGKVNFSGEVGGHAWVQVYEDGEWFELEATSGPFWDDEDGELVNNNGFPYNYFKSHPYPVVEYWAFFNDVYYYNPENGKGSSDLPPHWKQTMVLLSN